MKIFLPLALLVAVSQAQLIIGALALIEFVVEIIEAEQVVAVIEDSVDMALTGAEASESAAIEGTVTRVGTTVARLGESGSLNIVGDAEIGGFGQVSTRGNGFVQGTFTYRQLYRLGVGPGFRSSADPRIQMTYGVRTTGVRNGPQTKINFFNPTLTDVQLTNPGGVGTTVRFRGQPGTKLFAEK